MITQRLADALDFAVGAHGDQLRKGTKIPYVSHLLGVAALVLENGGGEGLAIAGLLHYVSRIILPRRTSLKPPSEPESLTSSKRAATPPRKSPSRLARERRECDIEHLLAVDPTRCARATANNRMASQLL